jgi:hypothetical protein
MESWVSHWVFSAKEDVHSVAILHTHLVSGLGREPKSLEIRRKLKLEFVMEALHQELDVLNPLVDVDAVDWLRLGLRAVAVVNAVVSPLEYL